MNKKRVRRLMLLFYCIPFVFLAMYGDALSGSMMFYGVMLAGFSLLCGIAFMTNNTNVLITGNLFSFFSSAIFTLIYLPGSEWNWYFKPLTPILLLILITAILFSIQYTIIKLSNKIMKRKQSKLNKI